MNALDIFLRTELSDNPEGDWTKPLDQLYLEWHPTDEERECFVVLRSQFCIFAAWRVSYYGSVELIDAALAYSMAGVVSMWRLEQIHPYHLPSPLGEPLATVSLVDHTLIATIRRNGWPSERTRTRFTEAIRTIGERFAVHVNEE